MDTEKKTASQLRTISFYND